VRQLVVFQSRAREPSPVYPAGRVSTPADPNIPPGGGDLAGVVSENRLNREDVPLRKRSPCDEPHCSH
jgi:hypothetical protein